MIYVLGVAVGLVVLALLVRAIEPRMAFFPLSGVQETPATLNIPYREISLRTADGESVYAWQLTRDEARATIVFWHGNGGNLSVWLDALAGIHANGFTVIALEYRGYGKASGSPSEQGLYKDTDALIEHIRSSRRQRQGPLIYWGRSLGGPVAAYATRGEPPDAIVLESTFPDVASLIGANPLMRLLSLFSSYRFPTAGHLRGFTGPILIMHGDRDSIIRYEQGQALFERITGDKQFVTIGGADHNDLAPADDQRYWRPVRDLVERVSRR